MVVIFCAHNINIPQAHAMRPYGLVIYRYHMRRCIAM